MKELIKEKKWNKARAVKTKDATVVMEKMEVGQRWSQYIGELFGDEREDFEDQNEHGESLESLDFLESEVRHAMKDTRRG